MPEPHVIRLRAPWESSLQGTRRRLQRHFHSRTGLTPQSRVFLVLCDLPGAWVTLNDQRLSALSEGRFEISALLQPRNLLTIEQQSPDIPQEPNVWLEIDEL